jgi:alpha-D-ribose 1-methylphosphonate 5-triphosphate synthase subunit PhnI
VPPVISPSMAAGSFTVGGFTESTILFDRELLAIAISQKNEDDFVRNLFTVRAGCAARSRVVVGLLKGVLPTP